MSTAKTDPVADDRNLDSDTLKERHEYGIDVDCDRIYLEGEFADPDAAEVNWFMARKFRKNLDALVDALEGEPGPITVDINTPGGDEQAGMSIFDAIRQCPARLIGWVTGEASSMGCVILQAFPERVVEPHASVMYHAGDSAVSAPSQEFKAAAKHTTRFGDRIDRAVYARVLERQPALTWSEFQVATMRGIYLIGQEAVDYGLADRVATKEVV